MKSINLTCKIQKKDDHYSLRLPTDYQRAMHMLMEYCFENKGGFCSISISQPKTKKSTGAKSQNSHFHGHVAMISESTGQPIEDVKKYLKDQAVTRGYPILMKKDENGDDIEPIQDFWGNIQGDSMKDITSAQCSMLIEQSHQLADEMGIKLIEGTT